MGGELVCVISTLHAHRLQIRCLFKRHQRQEHPSRGQSLRRAGATTPTPTPPCSVPSSKNFGLLISASWHAKTTLIARRFRGRMKLNSVLSFLHAHHQAVVKLLILRQRLLDLMISVHCGMGVRLGATATTSAMWGAVCRLSVGLNGGGCVTIDSCGGK